MKKILLTSILLLLIGFTSFSQTTINSKALSKMYGKAFIRAQILKTSELTTLSTKEEISLQLFSDLTIVARKSNINSQKTKSGYLWKGELTLGGQGYLELFSRNGKINGSVYMGSTVYKLDGSSDGILRVIELHPNEIPDHVDDEIITPIKNETYQNKNQITANASKATATDPSIIDVMVLYPLSLQTLMGGAAGLENEIYYRIAETNQVFSNSGIHVELRLVHHQIETSVNENTSSAADVRTTEVFALRDQYQVDLVSYWSTNGTVGSGYTFGAFPGNSDYGVNTCNISQVQSQYTFAHEIGHNLGALHDRQTYVEISSTSSSLLGTPYYRYGKSFVGYRSVMSYANCNDVAGGSNSNCSRVPYFTNPDVIVNGQSFGVSGDFQTYDPNGPANNALRINEVAPYVEAYRESQVVQYYNLTVNNGTGSGSYEQGDIVQISANTPPSGMVFDKWTGDTNGISNQSSSSTSISVLNTDIIITATYKTVASGINIALNGVASQSSTSHSGLAALAIDGNTNGAWSNTNNSVTHTNAETNPWWQVDLGSDKLIGDIYIFNRTDNCCMARLSNFTVSVINSSGATTYAKTYTTYPDPSISLNTNNAIGSIVKVQINGSGNPLSLAEVQVFEGEGSVGFTPDPNKTYYIDAPHHNLRLAADGSSQSPETTSTNTTGANVEWKFVAKGNGSWHIHRADGGAFPVLRTNNSQYANMVDIAYDGDYTYYHFEQGYINNSYFITVTNGPANHKRLQVDAAGEVKMVSTASNLTWESFTFTEVSENGNSFTPDPNKTYYIDAPVHNLRLAADGEDEFPYTTGTSATGANVEWKFIAKGNGSWHIQRAAGGTVPRLRTDGNSNEADMQETTSSGIYTYFNFQEGATNGTHFITLPDGPSNYQRLQIYNTGVVRMVTTASVGTWESFRITEVTDTAASCTDGTNLALNASVVDFSSEENATNGVNNINDGNDGNRWSAVGYPQYVVIDLGDQYNIDQVNVLPYADRAYQFLVEGSANSASSGFSVLTNATGNTSGGSQITKTFSSQTVRYVKLTITGASGYTGTWSAIKEFEVICAGNSSSNDVAISDDLANSITNNFDITIYPIPFTSSLTVDTSNTNQTIGSIRLIDLSGKILVTENKRNTISNLDNINSGLYFLQILNIKGQILSVEKVLKE